MWSCYGHRAVVLCAVMIAAGMAVSCNQESPAYNRENLKATWIVDTYDGNLLDERNYTVMTFTSSGTVVYEGVLTLDSANYQWGENTLRYDIYCCDFSISGVYSGLYGHLEDASTRQEYSFVLSEDSLMTLGVESYTINGFDVTPEYSEMTMRKIPLDYAVADTIYGVWQFNTRNGEEFMNYRVQFQPENVLSMSVRSGENSWDPVGNGEDYYRLYEDYLVMTLYDNWEFGTTGKWDVKCFLIDSISAASGRMTLSSGPDEYVLSYISSN